MMACSYLSAGGTKSDQTSAACWSPPAMAGCLATETRQTLPSGPMCLQSGLAGLPRASLPRGLMAIPSRGLHSGQVGLPSRPTGMPSGSLGLPSAPVALPRGQLELPSGPDGPMVLPNAQMGLPPPFARPLPMDLHSAGSQPEPSASEPALDLSTSAPAMTSSLKIQLPSPNENTE